MQCLNCEKDLIQLPQKRQKQFCNSTCRSNYWQKAKRKLEQITQKPIKLLGERIDMDAIENVVLSKEPLPEYEITILTERKKQLEYELAHPVSNPIVGMKMWKAVREKEIKEIKEIELKLLK